jgi:hypothetical protein
MPADPAHERRYQVFVSSTFVDLIDERRKVLEAILETQSFPAGMELFPSADDEQFEFIKREIESSDYYIVIVAGRYGSLAPDGLSFTEKEYNYALELGKPVMAFLHKDLGELKGKALEATEEQRKRLDAFRSKVSAGKLVNFYTNPDQLKAQALHALNSAFRLKPQTGWVRATNARRVEDLEEITHLQKRLMELEAEVLRLREANADPRRLLGSGTDVVDFKFALRSPLPPQPGGGPPVWEVQISCTWDEILLELFRPRESMIYDQRARERFLDFIFRQITHSLLRSEIERTAAPAPPNRPDLLLESIDAAFDRIAAHFSGLGYVRMTIPNADWELTQDGLTRLAIALANQKSTPHSS